MHNDITQDIISKGFESFTVDGETYFKLEDIRRNFPDLKVNPTKIFEFIGEGMRMYLVHEHGLSPMTEFDKKIRQSLQYNVKK